MDDFDSPLDLDDDGDDAIEMCLLFAGDKKKGTGGSPQGSGGCCIVLLFLGSSFVTVGWSVVGKRKGTKRGSNQAN